MSNDTSLPNEQWRDIPGYEGYYQVTDYGSVRSVDRITPHGHFRRGRPRKLDVNKSGHMVVTLTREKVRRKEAVHRLVLLAFVGPCPPGMIACHNDGNPKNNHVSNLRWGTNSSNMLDRVKHGTCFNSNKKQCPRGHGLVDGNLVPANLRHGSRTCWACERARGYLKRRPHLRDRYQEVSDRYYAILMGRAV